MKTINYRIHYGGFVGCEDDFKIEVDDNATKEEIEKDIQKDYEERIFDNCCWTMINEYGNEIE